MKKIIIKFLLINVGLIIMALGLNLFLIPANLAVGGVTGLAMIINTYIPNLSVGLLVGVFNVILLIIAFIFVGKEFGGYTIYSSIALSFFIWAFENLHIINGKLTDDILLNLLFGVGVQGLGMAIIFYENSSTGGTDIVAKILNKYVGLKIGMSLFIVDAIITLFAAKTFGITLGLYAFLGVLFNGLVIDAVISGFDTKVHALVISDNFVEISKFIKNDLDRGFTLFYAEGGYKNQEKRVISIVFDRRQYLILKKYITENYPESFLIVDFVHDVIGNGFNKTI